MMTEAGVGVFDFFLVPALSFDLFAFQHIWNSSVLLALGSADHKPLLFEIRQETALNIMKGHSNLANILFHKINS
jgi:hypothetical protein